MPDPSQAAGRHLVASASDVREGEMTIVTAGGVEVLLSRVGGRFHACGAHCTHYGAPLADGALHGRAVVCPWHHARFDVTTGELLDPPALDRLPLYHVEVEGEDVYVVLPDDAADTPSPAAYRESAGEAPAHVGRDFDSEPVTNVIVGAGAAAQAAAEAMREAGFRGRVIMVTQETSPPYDRTQLSKGYMGGLASDADLPLRGTDFHRAHEIELQLDSRVARVDVRNRVIHFENADALEYDQVLIASGGVARRLDVPGAGAPGVRTLRSWADGRAFVDAIAQADRVVIVGASFIAMETAAFLRKRGIRSVVVSIESVPFEAVLGREIGSYIQRIHEGEGVEFALGTGVERIDREGSRYVLMTTDGDVVDGAAVLLAVGVEPATAFVEGVPRADDGGIIVDERLRAAENVWVAGDVAAFPDWRTGRRVRIEHWRVAQQHGRVAGYNMAGRSLPYRGVPFFWTNQHSIGLRYLGFAAGWDEIVVDGEVDSGKFIAYYLRGGRMLAAAGNGRDREMAALHALMLAGLDPDPRSLRDGFDPVSALQAADG